MNALYIFTVAVAISLAAVAVWLLVLAAWRGMRRAIVDVIDPHPNARLTIEGLFALGPEGMSVELDRREKARQAPFRGIVSRLRAQSGAIP
jgi:hypothetical protein